MGLTYFLSTIICAYALLASVASDCAKNWLEFQDHCYFLNGRIGSAYTWHKAEEYCRLQGARLASIHSAEENEFIAKKAFLAIHPAVWLGLNTLEDTTRPSWLDGTPIDFTRVNVSVVDNTRRCAALDSPDPNRRWLFMHCDTEGGLVCKRKRDEQVVTIPPPVTTENPGNCPQDWNRIGNKCFKIFSSKDGPKVNHSVARSQCAGLGQGHDLASIHSKEENLFLTTLTANEETNLWIGLSRITFTTFGWTDNTQLDFTNWAPGEPSSVAEGCTEFLTTKLQAGLWNDNSCRQLMGYICQRSPDLSIPTSLPPKEDCPIEGFIRFGESCYKAIEENEKDTWEYAEKACKGLGAELASLHTGQEMAFLKTSILTNSRGPLWIGLRTTKERVYQWSDGWPVTYLGFPDKFSPSSEECAFINENGTWNMGNCNVKRGFICKVNEESVPDFPELDNRPCPARISPLLDLGLKNCYAIRQSASFGGAYLQCTKNDTVLASFHHRHELELLAPHLIDRPNGFWIGQVRKFHGRFEWLDGTKVDFQFWDVNEPSSKPKQDCVVLSPITLKAKAVDCNESYPYICMINKA